MDEKDVVIPKQPYFVTVITVLENILQPSSIGSQLAATRNRPAKENCPSKFNSTVEHPVKQRPQQLEQTGQDRTTKQNYTSSIIRQTDRQNGAYCPPCFGKSSVSNQLNPQIKTLCIDIFACNPVSFSTLRLVVRPACPVYFSQQQK